VEILATPVKPTDVNPFKSIVPVEPTDIIYLDRGPIVVESHKLIFFDVAKVASTSWKKMIRRIMGFEDWSTRSPHGPTGILYLNRCNISRQTELMNSPDYTRAIFVRDPKDRVLSAFRNKLTGDWPVELCCSSDACSETIRTFQGFLDVLVKCEKPKCCENKHWRPMSQRLDAKFHGKLDFIGHLETAHEDARQLLEQIGAWEEYGQSGWGRYGNESFFESKSDVKNRNDAKDHRAEYYTPELEKVVEAIYETDYLVFSLPKTKVSYK